MMKIITLLPLADWLAMGIFFAMWMGYALFAKNSGYHERSLIATTNHYRCCGCCKPPRATRECWTV